MEDQSQAVSQPAVANEPAAPSTLAQALRVKFPGKYNNLSDTELEQATIAVHPEYATWPRTHVSSQEAIAAMHKVNDATAPAEKPADMGDAMKRVAGGVVTEGVNAVKGLPHAVMHPIDTLMGVVDASAGHVKQAVSEAGKGHYAAAAGHAAGAFPVVGPAAYEAGEELGRTGDVPRAVGRGAALIGMTAGPALAKPAGAAVEAVGATRPGAALADAMASKGGEMVSKAITPVRGAGATKFAGMANGIGEALAADPALGGMTKPGFHISVQSELGKAGDALDAASNARLKNTPIATQPIIDALEARIASKTQAQPLTASRVGPPTRSTPTGQNIGIGPGTPHPSNAAGMAGKAQPMGSVVDLSDPQTAAHAEQLRKAVDEIKALGPQTSYEALQKIRQSYDNVAKPGVYISTPADVLTAGRNVGSARGAADVAGTVRETLAQVDPVTAKANARYSLMRRADDVMEALKISEQTRPTVGRTMMAATMGALGGGKIGAFIGPIVDVALRSGPSFQLVAGRTLGQMARMIRTGDTAGLQALAAKLQKAGFTGEAGQEPQ